MNIDTSITKTKSTQNAKNPGSTAKNDSNVKFSDELKSFGGMNNEINKEQDKSLNDAEALEDISEKKQDADDLQDRQQVDRGYNDALQQNNNKLEKNLSTNDLVTDNVTLIANDQGIAQGINPMDEMLDGLHGIIKEVSDKKKQDEENNGDNMTDNINMNIQDKQDNIPQLSMSMNMNFSGNEAPFSSLMNENNSKKDELTLNINDLKEENDILSTMSENIAMVNKHKIANQQKSTISTDDVLITNDETDERLNLYESKEKTVNRNDGIKKIDTKSGVTIETVVKYDNIIVNKDDVEVFASLVNNENVNLNELTSETVSKSTQISKTLADMLAKAKEDNQPLRIDFDNDISVIIRISRDGKLSADFLPSSNVAEAYLRDNLPLLKQKLDEQDVEYDELNQREQESKDEQRNNKRKDRKDNE